MRLAAKLTLLFAFSILAVLGVYFFLQTRHEVVLWDIDVRRSRYFGRGAAAGFSEVWRTDGLERTKAVIEEIDRTRPDVRLRLTFLDAPVGSETATVLDDAERARVEGGEVVVVHREDEQGRWRYTYVALTGPPGDARKAAAEFRESLSEEMTFNRTNHWMMAMATVTISVLVGLMGLAAGFVFVGRPVAALRDEARRVASGDLSHRVRLRQRDEIGDLATEINVMCDQLQDARRRLDAEVEARINALDALRHADRLATIGRLAAGVAHELGTPLNVVEMRAKMITSGAPVPPEVGEHARVIAEQSKRMATIIRQLLDFARRRPTNPASTDLRTIVASVVQVLGPVARRGQVDLAVETGDTPVMVHVDRAQIEQALGNLIVNGVQAMPNGGRLVARVGWREGVPPAEPNGPARARPCVTIEDEGPGIGAADLAKIFEPFFTTKPVGEGTGLGLSVTHGIATDHGGWIDVESTIGRGTRFHLVLPAVDEPRAVAQGGTAV